MDTVIVKGGKFTFTLNHGEMARGLRPSKRMARNTEYLVECDGAVGIDGNLSILDSITKIATATITDGFPFPQIFIFTNMLIVCGLGKIYEWDGSSLVLKYTATMKGSVWSAVDFFDYVWLSNGSESVIRDAGSKVYAIDTTQPKAQAMCNYNGQVIIGAPDCVGLGASLALLANPLAVTMSQEGSIS